MYLDESAKKAPPMPHIEIASKMADEIFSNNDVKMQNEMLMHIHARVVDYRKEVIVNKEKELAYLKESLQAI